MARATKFLLAALAVSVLTAPPISAEILESTEDHFVLRLDAQSTLPPSELWERLIVPSRWWQSGHTYSGDAMNITLDATAGGLWREDWDGGSVAHGTVVLALPPKILRLQAPFGPLQGLAVNCVWTITISPSDAGSAVRFDFVANGSPSSGVGGMADAVHSVKSAALASLVEPPN